MDLIDEIEQMKDRENAVVLVHNYQRQEIYEVADYIGDSLELSRAATETDADIIVFCGVDFMAETAKILNPDKKVLLPVGAKCPMAATVTAYDLRKIRDKYPKAAVVSYVNTTAEVKAESDICCTSANAVKIVNSLPNEQVIFVPDKNLADYVATKTDKGIIPWNGICYVHNRFSAVWLEEKKNSHPNAKIIVHPECKLRVIEMADQVCSTSGMLRYVSQDNRKEFIIGTEMGLVRRLKSKFPEKEFYSAPPPSTCAQMKKNRLELLLKSLQKDAHQIKLSSDTTRKAKMPIEEMLNIM